MNDKRCLGCDVPVKERRYHGDENPTVHVDGNGREFVQKADGWHTRVYLDGKGE